MRSKSSIRVDDILKRAYRIRTRNGLPSYEVLHDTKWIINSNKYKMPLFAKKLYNATLQDIEGCDSYSFGQGSHCIMYLHGGAYVRDPLILHWRFLAKLSSESDCAIVAPIYNKAPEYKADTTVPQMVRVFRHLVSQYGADNITIMGDSSGGGLALAMCEYMLRHDMPQPKRMILLSPWLDVSMDNADIPHCDQDYMLWIEELKMLGRMYSQDVVDRYLFNPIEGITSGLAPIYMFVGSPEMLLPDCLLAKQLCDRVSTPCKLYEFPYMQHVFLVQPVGEAVEARNMIVDIIKER